MERMPRGLAYRNLALRTVAVLQTMFNNLVQNKHDRTASRYTKGYMIKRSDLKAISGIPKFTYNFYLLINTYLSSDNFVLVQFRSKYFALIKLDALSKVPTSLLNHYLNQLDTDISITKNEHKCDY